MAKRDIKKALGASLKAEEQAVKSRFEKAETVLGKSEPAPRKQPTPPDGAGKLTTDSLHIPDGEDKLLSRLKRRCRRAGISADKSEILRAGLAALDRMQDRELERLFDGLPGVKSARPEREFLTFVVHRTYTIRFRHTLQVKHFQFVRKIVIRHRSS